MENFQDYQEQPVTSQSLFNCKQEANEYFPDIVVIEAAINGLRIGVMCGVLREEVPADHSRAL